MTSFYLLGQWLLLLREGVVEEEDDSDDDDDYDDDDDDDGLSCFCQIEPGIWRSTLSGISSYKLTKVVSKSATEFVEGVY